MKICGIYGLKNIANGKWYIGQSIDLIHRKYRHFNELRAGAHRNQHLQASFNTYGQDSFEFHILEKLEESMLDIRETSWISYYKSTNPDLGYNSESGGNKNKRHSVVTIAKMRLARTGKKLSEVARRKLSIWHTGKKHTAEAKEKMRRYRLGRPTAESTKQKLQKAMAGRKFSQETIKKMKNIRSKMWKDPDYRQKMLTVLSAARQKITPEVTAKMAKSKLGYRIPEAVKQKMSLAQQLRRKREKAT